VKVQASFVAEFVSQVSRPKARCNLKPETKSSKPKSNQTKKKN
jgi:hypothetical protein